MTTGGFGIPIPDRVLGHVWSRIDVGSPEECWLSSWSVASHGYGQIGWHTRGETRKGTTAHRAAWESWYGPIPCGLTIDHICRVKRCCNPRHLRLLTNTENGRDNGFNRRTHCPHGHEYAGDNLYVNPLGHRHCRACQRARWHARRAR